MLSQNDKELALKLRSALDLDNLPEGLGLVVLTLAHVTTYESFGQSCIPTWYLLISHQSS